jgi:hypothetical protein
MGKMGVTLLFEAVNVLAHLFGVPAQSSHSIGPKLRNYFIKYRVGMTEPTFRFAPLIE